MLGLILFVCVLILFAVIYLGLMINKAFITTNTNIDSYTAKLNLIIKAADRIVSVEKNLLKTVMEDQNQKG